MTAFREQNLPERALMRPDDSDGFREAWSILENGWPRLEHFPLKERLRIVLNGGVGAPALPRT